MNALMLYYRFFKIGSEALSVFRVGSIPDIVLDIFSITDALFPGLKVSKVMAELIGSKNVYASFNFSTVSYNILL